MNVISYIIKRTSCQQSYLVIKRKTLRKSNLAIQAYGSHIFLGSYLRYIGKGSRPWCKNLFLAGYPVDIVS